MDSYEEKIYRQWVAERAAQDKKMLRISFAIYVLVGALCGAFLGHPFIGFFLGIVFVLVTVGLAKVIETWANR